FSSTTTASSAETERYADRHGASRFRLWPCRTRFSFADLRIACECGAGLPALPQHPGCLTQREAVRQQRDPRFGSPTELVRPRHAGCAAPSLAPVAMAPVRRFRS